MADASFPESKIEWLLLFLGVPDHLVSQRIAHNHFLALNPTWSGEHAFRILAATGVITESDAMVSAAFIAALEGCEEGLAIAQSTQIDGTAVVYVTFFHVTGVLQAIPLAEGLPIEFTP